MRRCSRVLLSGCLLAFGVLLPAQLVADDPSTEALAARLDDVGLRIERQIEVARFNAENGRLDQAVLEREARDAAAALDSLEQRLRGLPEGQAEPLAAKLASVRVQARNLARAAQLEGSAPPRPSQVEGRTRHLDRWLRSAESAPGNDDCEMAYAIGFGTFAGDTSEATNDGEASCGSSLYSPDVWYAFTAPTSGRVVIETVGSSYDTVLSVHTGCRGIIMNEMVCNDDFHGLQSAVSFYASVGTNYIVRLSGFGGAVGQYVLTASTSGGVQGSVVETGTGDPVSTRVEAYDGDGYSMGSDYTDDAGAYQVEGLATGTYFVATDSYSGVIDELYDDHPCPGGAPYGCDVTTGDPVAVTVGTFTGGIDFVLDRAGEIAGFVRDEQSQQGIADAEIRVYDSDGNHRGSAGTNAEGAYLAGHLAAGTYFVATVVGSHGDEAYDDIPCPGGPPSGCDITQATPIEVRLNTTTTDIDFELRRLGAITGAVTDRASGDPISWARVNVHDHEGYRVGYAYCSSGGSYEVAGLVDGTYYVVAESSFDYVDQLYYRMDCPSSGCDPTTGTPVVIDNQSTASGIDFDLVRKGSITGTVVDSTTTAGVGGVMVRVVNESGHAAGWERTDSAGHYTADRLQAGTYFVLTDDNDYVNQLYNGIPCPDGCDPTTGTPVVVVNGTITGSIDFEIVPKGVITGLVVAQAGGEPLTMRTVQRRL